MAVDRDQGDGLAARLSPAEIEGGDIDPGRAQGGAEPPDESGRVLVDDIDHLADQLGLDADAEQFDQPWRGAPEQGACDRAAAGPCLDRDPHQRVVIAFAVVADLAYVEAALARQ